MHGYLLPDVRREIRDPVTFEHKARILAVLMVGVNACMSVRTGPASQELAWPAYLGSPARVSERADSLSEDPQAVWRASVSRGLVGAPALAEDVVAVSQVDQQVALLDRATGDLLWRRRVRGNPGAGPLLADDRLFFGTQGNGGSVGALRLVDGKSLWTTRLGDVVAPVTLDGGTIYAATSEGWVAALEAASGRQLWRSRVPGSVRVAPVPTGAGIVVATTLDSLYRLDAGTGRITLRRGTRGPVLAAPALADGVLVIGTAAGRLSALDTATLEPAWTHELGSGVVGAVAVRGGTAYALTTAGALWTVPLAHPAGAHSVGLGIVSRAGPLPAARGVYVAAVDGRLMRIGANGTPEWTVRVRSPLVEPAVQDGRMLFVVSQRGEVVAFR